MAVETKAPPSFEAFRATKFFPALDGLRCLSIVAVLLYHADCRLPGLLGVRGSAGVDLFFVISGFLITTLLLRERDARGAISLRNFYVRRTLRIFPLYYAVLAAFVVATLLFDRGTVAGHEFFRHLPLYAVYANNWVIDKGPRRVIFACSWSLATEEQFYLFWPSVLAFCKKRWQPPAIIAGVMVATWALQGLTSHGVVDLGEMPNRILTSAAPGICMGCLLAFALNDRACFEALRGPLGSRWTSLAALAAVLVLSSVRAVGIDLIRAAMVVLLASVVVNPDYALRPMLENRAARHVGVVSYGIYLLFTLVLNLGTRTLHTQSAAIKFAWMMGVSTVLATLVFRYYETPFLRLKERFTKPASEAGAEPAAEELPVT